jgi:hypothetical protein
MAVPVLLDAAGRRRSPATMPGFHCGGPPCNKGLRYPADPPAVEEIVAVMRVAGGTAHGLRTERSSSCLARRSAHQRGTRAGRERRRSRSRSRSRQRSRPTRQGRQALTGWHRSVGVGAARPRGFTPGCPLPLARCCVSSTGRHADGRSHPPRHERRVAALPLGRACAGASLRTSSDTRTRSRWPANACRST